MSKALETLNAIRSATGAAQTTGLTDDVIERFLAEDPALGQAIEAAAVAFEHVRTEFPELLGDEVDAIELAQSGYVNFYSAGAVNPYVALAAKGAWVVTLHGAVVHDNGGYGMLGFGHNPDFVIEAMSKPQVMANIMTASAAQLALSRALRKELGHARTDAPFPKVLCMNSGSEAMTVAARIADIHSKNNAKGRKTTFLGIERAFHGRTDRPAQLSDSSLPVYRKYCKSFADRDNLWTVPANDVAALEAAFQRAADENVYIEVMFMEPVQGEGSPGMAMTREFYDAARRLTLAHDTLFVVDSIQAGLRATGCLSIVDYPGFEDCVPPDMESWSKALNGGQYPLSVLGLSDRAVAIYQRGVYGNTMTTNPRALDVAVSVLDAVDDSLRQNIRRQGKAFIADLEGLATEFPGLITEVQGTGLLFCAELDPAQATVIGPGSAEERMRLRGVGVIHGGRNALRFTPHFRITDAERALVIDTLREVLAEIQGEVRKAG
ncbi:MAG: aminotransferase class III-fold pyridoxal phosphate-dependent enzyme [Deltaproteobacteria bacterium]|nr:MAG: aminotransferase class III-fold pyridoxal phosphate-dependent enzyme [Deltaproteobacteria bacterium]